MKVPFLFLKDIISPVCRYSIAQITSSNKKLCDQLVDISILGIVKEGSFLPDSKALIYMRVEWFVSSLPKEKKKVVTKMYCLSMVRFD